MKAIVYTKYGAPDVLQVQEIEKPIPKDHEVLVKVHASSLNAADLDLLHGTFLIRLGGFTKPAYNILGSDIAGQVEAIGKNVTQFQVGDAVFGDLTGYGFGAFAEYVCAPEKALALKSAQMTFGETATLCSAAVIALQSLRGKRPVKSGQKVLINGAGGGVGTFAVQIAKFFGAEVTGVDSTEKLDMLRSIGADHVMDYTCEDYTMCEQCYDLIVDVVANRPMSNYKRALSPSGIFTMVGGSTSTIFQAMLLGSWMTRGGSQSIGVLMAQQSRTDLDFVKELLESAKIKPVIDKSYPLSETAEAIRYLETSRARGKVVINIV